MAKKRYDTYTTQTQKFMTAVEAFIRQKYGKMESQWEGQLTLLATNYDLFIQAKAQIDKDGIMIPNRLGQLDKHPLLRVLTDCNIQVIKIIHEFGLSPSAVGKIKEMAEDNDEILELLNG